MQDNPCSLVWKSLILSTGTSIEITILHRPQDRRLHFDRDRIVLRLLEHFDDALAAFEPRLRLRVEVGTELRERRQFAELREVDL